MMRGADAADSQRCGAAVVEAPNAEKAIESIAASGANILISDIGMAREDGYQLLRRLRGLGYGPDVLPAIALTAFARTEDRSAALAPDSRTIWSSRWIPPRWFSGWPRCTRPSGADARVQAPCGIPGTSAAACAMTDA